MKAKIYTKTGDKGTTRLVDGSCVEKFNPRVEAYGTVDELNSYLGVVRSSLATYSHLADLDPVLEKIQNELFNVGSLLACADEKLFQKLPQIEEKSIVYLEQRIDEMTSALPELRQFILPAGHLVASHLHVARTFCRRSERRTAEIAVKESLYSNCLIYLNRLSDFLFVAARWTNHQSQVPDVVWKKSE